VKIDGNKIHLSKIFEWYYKDFGNEDGDILGIIGKYYENEKNDFNKDEKYKLIFNEYNWDLNE
jgi:hypothetical protein